jgi:hypothetical protein
MLTVTKTFSGNNSLLPAGFAVTVTKDGEQEPAYTLTLNGSGGTTAPDTGTAYTWTLSEVPVGTYTIAESNAAINGYDLAASSVTSGSATLGAGSLTATVALSNTYTQKFGVEHDLPATLTVTKVDQGEKPLAGAGFTVYDNPACTSDDIYISEQTTGRTAKSPSRSAETAPSTEGEHGARRIWASHGVDNPISKSGQIRREGPIRRMFHRVLPWLISLGSSEKKALRMPSRIEHAHLCALTVTKGRQPWELGRFLITVTEEGTTSPFAERTWTIMNRATVRSASPTQGRSMSQLVYYAVAESGYCIATFDCATTVKVNAKP